jgi:precorrin-6B methylase 2
MAESKTARASAVRVVKEVHIESVEEAIKAIRVNRAAGLFIGDMSRVDKLLQAYDEMSAANDAAVAQVGADMQTLAALSEKLKNVEIAFTEQMTAAANKIDALQKKLPTVVMAEVDNSERPEDEFILSRLVV